MKWNTRNVLHTVVHTSKTLTILAAVLMSVAAPLVLKGTVAAASAPNNLRLVSEGITHPCGMHTNSSYITPTWDAAIGADSYNYMVTRPDGSVRGPQNVGNVTSVSGLFEAEGTSSFSVQTVYAESLTSEWAPPCNATYDTIKPVISSNIASGTALKGTVAVTETVTEAHPHAYNIRILDAAGNAVSVNGKNLGAYASPVNGNSLTYNWNTTQVVDGPYKIQLSARDKAKNAETIIVDVNVDNKMPGVIIDKYPAPINDSTPTISGNVDENNTTVHVTVGDMTYTATPNAGRWSITTNNPLPDGTYAISAVATDAAGNATTPPADGSITIDTTVPRVVITNPIGGSTAHGTVQISGNVTDAASHTLSINGSPVLSGTTGNVSYLWDTSDFVSGTYIITLSATDGASNTAEDSVSIRIDNTAPAIPFHISPANIAAGTSGMISALSWMASEDPSGPVSYTVEVASDPGFGNIVGSSSTIGTAYGLGGMIDGTYYWRLQACDGFGNCSGWSSAWAFTIDNTAPVVTIDDSDTMDTTPLIKGTVNDAGAVVTIRVSGITYAAVVNTTPNASGTYDWSANVTQRLSYGPHSITIFARDSLGNNSVQSGAITIIGTSAETNDTISRLAHAGSILGNSNQTGIVSDTAATDTKEQAETSAKNDGREFLGLGWWWLPLLTVLLGATYYGYTYKNTR